MRSNKCSWFAKCVLFNEPEIKLDLDLPCFTLNFEINNNFYIHVTWKSMFTKLLPQFLFKDKSLSFELHNFSAVNEWTLSCQLRHVQIVNKWRLTRVSTDIQSQVLTNSLEKIFENIEGKEAFVGYSLNL